MATMPLDQNGECTDDMSVEHLLPLDPSDACDDLGEPDILPRIGDEYQLQIPPSIVESSYTRNSTEVRSEENFFVGLPVPLVWITLEQDNNVMEKEDSKNEIFGINVEPSCYSVEGIRESESLPSEDKFYLSSNQCKLFLVPELHSESWSDIEKDSFLLGLYIFEKNFVQLKKFIGSKKMDAISSFYHGKFYGSDSYHRWSEGRKMRNKRCVYGDKIFSGLRQQELLSRLFPRISEEFRTSLLEVSKSFGEGTMSLQDYIFSLKSMVGMNALIEAIAIGKGKQDLTGMALETPRSNQVRPEIPTGQAWSSLKASEIVKFLTGDYRLSKARSNDLFWEAVWPRLLARGWHSEKSKDQPHIAGLKHGLVFLIPGVKKFSRKKLVKGDHYFDSVSDVLGKVAKEPELLKLEEEEEEEEAGGFTFNKDKEQEEKDLPTRQRHCYLQPRTPNRRVERMTFAVVDTSLIDGKTYILRELRSLPFEISNLLTSKTRPEVSDEESTDESTKGSDTVNTVDVDSGETTKSNGAPSQDTNTISPEVDNILLSSLKNRNNVHEDKPSKHVIYSRRRRKQKRENVDSIAPIAKRDKLSSTSSSKGSSIGSVETDTPLDPGTQTSIDLNFPQVPMDMENGLLQTESQNSSAIEANSYEQQQASMNVRRHGTRNRPPTSRALEALANGFLTVNRRQKSKSTSR